MAEKIRQHLAAEPFRVELNAAQFKELGITQTDNPHTEQITASFGVALCEDARQFNDTVKRADTLLYQSKHNGRNRVS